MNQNVIMPILGLIVFSFIPTVFASPIDVNVPPTRAFAKLYVGSNHVIAKNYLGQLNITAGAGISVVLSNGTTAPSLTITNTGSGGGSSGGIFINGLNRTAFTGIVANHTFPAPTVTINGLNASIFTIQNVTINGHVGQAFTITNFTDSDPAPKISINGNNRSSFTGIIANVTLSAPKIVINGNNRSSFINVGNTSTINIWTSTNQWSSSGALYENPSKTFATTLSGAAVTANRTLNLPLITGTDTLGALGLAQIWSSDNTFIGNVDFHDGGIKTDKFDSCNIVIRNVAGTFGITLCGSAITANRTLNLPLTTQTETLAVQPQTLTAAPSNPTGTSSTTGVMAGLGSTCTITPRVTGKVFVIITGQGTTNTGDDGWKADLRISSVAGQSAPANGVALSGTIIQVGLTGQGIASSTTTDILTAPIGLQGIVSGLTVGSAYWIDIGEYAVTGGTATFTNLKCTAFEM